MSGMNQDLDINTHW